MQLKKNDSCIYKADQKNFEDLVSMLEPNYQIPLVFFVGSGISAAPPSEIPVAKVINRRILDKAFAKVRTSAVGKRFRFRNVPGELMKTEVMMEQILQSSMTAPSEELPLGNEESVASLLKSLFLHRQHNTNHEFLIWLIESGMTDIIMTTNIDACLEQCMSSARVVVFNEQYRKLNEIDFSRRINGSPILAKLHGSITVDSKLTVGSAIVTIQRVMSGLEKHKQTVLAKIIKNRPICILGWGGYDRDICPTFFGTSSKHPIYWVFPESSTLPRWSLWKSRATLSHRLKSIRIVSHDEKKFLPVFLSGVSSRIGGPLLCQDVSSVSQFAWAKDELDGWVDMMSEYECCWMLGELCHDLNFYMDANRFYRIAKELDMPPRLVAMAEFRKGCTEMALSNYRVARELFSRSKEKIDSLWKQEDGDEMRLWDLRIMLEQGVLLIREHRGVAYGIIRRAGLPEVILKKIMKMEEVEENQRKATNLLRTILSSLESLEGRIQHKDAGRLASLTHAYSLHYLGRLYAERDEFGLATDLLNEAISEEESKGLYMQAGASYRWLAVVTARRSNCITEEVEKYLLKSEGRFEDVLYRIGPSNLAQTRAELNLIEHRYLKVIPQAGKIAWYSQGRTDRARTLFWCVLLSLWMIWRQICKGFGSE